MKATNITASIPAAMFSARRRSQAAGRAHYFSALIFSSIPFGHSFASSEAR